ncbi:MAG: LytTR family DNA-binding domain-containing protein [Gemmatimonadales bacterium]|nr:LytTR family DNA-binding domain-containing protein [Gemmatimonadales bacterium]
MSGPFRVLVVDDEPLARDGMAALAARDPELAVVGCCGDAGAALAALGEQEVDILLLDIRMPGRSGLDLLRAIPPTRRPAVIFVTAHDAFAVPAFDEHAVDYLLKPFTDERFRAAIARAKQRSRSGSVEGMLAGVQRLLAAPVPAPASAEAPDRLVVRDDGRTLLVRTADVDWIEAADYYAALHVGPRRLLLRESLTSLAARLDTRRFFRVHRSAIVNLDRVREIQPYFRGELVVVLVTGTKVRLTRARRAELERRLGAPL